MQLREKDFEFREDYILKSKCQLCGTVTINHEPDACPTCESIDITVVTKNEGYHCSGCGNKFYEFDDCYTHTSDEEDVHNIIVCESCYEDIV